MSKRSDEDIQVLGENALPHLWMDEMVDVFVLTRHMEVYVYNKTTLGCYCWSRKTYLQMHNMGLIFDVLEPDDHLYYFRTSIDNLPLILSLGAFKRRPHRGGQWIRSRERLLGHKIRPLRRKERTSVDG